VPEVVANVQVDNSLAEVWAFVRDMDNWAPMMKGYVKHEKHSEADSVWTLTGDLGPFSKTVDLKVHVTEWLDAERVAFEMEGVIEQVTATGSLELSDKQPIALPRSFWQRLLDWLLRRRAIGTGVGEANLTFTFSIQAGGPMGPMINPMLGPYSDAVARELLDSVASHLGPVGES